MGQFKPLKGAKLVTQAQLDAARAENGEDPAGADPAKVGGFWVSARRTASGQPVWNDEAIYGNMHNFGPRR